MSLSDWQKRLNIGFTNRAQRRRRKVYRARIQALEPRVLLTVENATGVTIAPTEASAFTGTVASFTSDDTDPANFAVSIDWGDGTMTAGTLTANGSGGFDVLGTHAYQEDGTKTLSVDITDGADSATGAATSTVDILESEFVAFPGDPIALTEGQTVSSFQVATFDDIGTPDGTADFSATINWGDGATDQGTITTDGEGFTVIGTHTYSDEVSGSYSVTISEPAANFTASPVSNSLTVTEADTLVPGIASLAATEGTTFTGAVATFTDPTYAGHVPVVPLGDDGPISDAIGPGNVPADFTATIAWGDGTTSVGTVTGGSGTFTVSGSHVYADEGSSPLLVTLTDDLPGTASATATGTATVSDDDTLAGTSITASSTEGATFSGTVATFTDTTYAGNVPGDFAANIDWGDGTTTAGAVTGSAGSFTVSGSHSYAEEGMKTATVVLSDDSPGTATGTATATLQVADATLLATGTTIALSEGSSFNGVVATFTDADPAGTVADYSATIDWGDGSTTAGSVTASNGGFNVSGSHKFVEDGTYTVTVTIADVGGSTTNATTKANIAEAALLGSSVTLSGFERTSLENVLVATFAHGDGSEPASHFTATISWGDGSTSTGVVTESATTYLVSGSHDYLDEGTFAISVQVTDDAASSTVTSMARIKEELLPNGTQGTPNERFIQEIYRDLFHRQVDTTALPYWANFLDHGQSRLQVVSAIIATAMPGELGADLVTGMFEKYLGRDPDSIGLAFWVGIVSKKETIEDTEANIVGTDEFFVLSGGTNEGFINRLFHLALGRDPETTAMMTFEADLAAGASREQVAEAVFNSDEFHKLEVAGYFQSPSDTNDRFFSTVPYIDDIDFLDRSADSQGLATFTFALDQGALDQVIWARMMASDEFFAKTA